ncbi:MAG TPA: right-handed parallel beta-helix repeat-containing protein [Herpetosiphonaceae bacterium]|nr:right-handed parallel beta-helix repeat-containing protein [Herpetosiphonaceae bacterium]
MRVLLTYFIVMTIFIPILVVSPPSTAPTYEVGPGKPYRQLHELINVLKPGDRVFVYGNGSTPYQGGVRFTRPGTVSDPIIIRGIAVNGRRPIISFGSSSSINSTIEFNADNYIFENFEATGTGTNAKVLYHHAANTLIRDTLVYNCPNHGVLGADSGAGSLTLERVEIHNCGNGQEKHPIYIGNSAVNSVFRMQYCYLHDQKGGNAVKSRAFRNEIYSNWIEGGRYRELELIGPDDGTGGTPESPREDGDIVGNVFVKRSDFAVNVRIGGDGTGQTWGRYRFVNNTFIGKTAGATAIQAFHGLESIELSNNVFVSSAGGGMVLVNTSNADWRDGQIIVGQRNWAQTGSAVPAPIQPTTLIGADAGFVNLAASDLRLTAPSPLRNQGTSAPVGPSGHSVPHALALPLFHPPLRTLSNPIASRPADTTIDIGAFEYMP